MPAKILKIKEARSKALCFFLWVFAATAFCKAETLSLRDWKIVCPPKPSYLHALASKELKRLLYLRTGCVLEITSKLKESEKAFVLSTKKDPMPIPDRLRAQAQSLPAQSFLLEKVSSPTPRIYLIGSDPVGLLYATYRFAEHIGFRFFLHGEVVPPKAPIKLQSLREKAIPLFSLRGIQPFHDFPEGPDWWDCDTYLAIASQLAKLRMNFIGLHTYPEGRPEAEPTVWIGLPEDLGPGPEVKFAYPASYQNTLRGNWGYRAKPTGSYLFGASELFDEDCWGSEIMRGICPRPRTQEECREVFLRTAKLFKRVFTFCKALGIKTCIGTETPLVVPAKVAERIRKKGKDPSAVIKDLYKGIFLRIMSAHPLDWYWLWTPEGWTWRGVKKETVERTVQDIKLAVEAARECRAPFRIATCGWVLGPQYDRALFDKVLPQDVALSCINRMVGNEPVDPAFAEVKRKDKWAIPWLEDDPGLTMPQLWVGRMREDAYDALRYGTSGLMGIHWRTRILGPNVLALAWAAWDQNNWRPLKKKEKKVEGALGGQFASFPRHEIKGTDLDPLYRTVRYNVKGYRFAVPNGKYTVTLRFCEPHYRQAGKRVFGVKIQDREVIKRLDIFERVGADKALDFTFKDVLVKDGILKIDFVKIVEFPSIAAIDITGPVKRKINCGGQAYRDWKADWPPSKSPKRGKPCGDFYLDWASSLFGHKVGKGAAEIFESIDGALPRPASWVGGPGGLRPDPRPWREVEKEYEFVESLSTLRPLVETSSQLERFDWWLNNFRYLKAMAKVRTVWASLNRSIAKAKSQKDKAAAKEIALKEALPLRIKLVQEVKEVYRWLLLFVSNTGELGTIANSEQHILPEVLDKTQSELENLLGAPLPEEALPFHSYFGPPRIIVPTCRTCVFEGEKINLRVLVLSSLRPVSLSLNWRPGYGKGPYQTLPLEHVARGVYKVTFPPKGAPPEGLEYYVEASFPWGTTIRFPHSAPEPAQSVTVVAKP